MVPIGVHQPLLAHELFAVVLALREGRTGLPIGGVFGAGKTRSAAVLLAGLLVFDPDLRLMVVTKENVAAHAFAEHLVALQLPEEVQTKMGRLVGYYEQRRKGAGTPIDIPLADRNQAIKQKSLLIGCGGGFQQECGQPYSPVAEWMKAADVVLEDEGQQYGNMEEAATIARTPRKCLEIWCGDHRQTPGGLQQTNEAKRFRRKLIRRPLALRCKTKYVQPQELGSIVCRHLAGPTGSPPDTLAKWLQGTSTPATEDVQTIWRDVIGLSAEQPVLPSQLQKAALAILWLAVKGEELTEVLSTTYAEACPAVPESP